MTKITNWRKNDELKQRDKRLSSFSFPMGLYLAEMSVIHATFGICNAQYIWIWTFH